MRSPLWYIVMAGVAVLAIVALLPILSVLAVVVLGLVAVAAVAPYLARLPWFRDRISVQKHRFGRSVRFGGTPEPQPRRPADDVIDVEGRELPDRD